MRASSHPASEGVTNTGNRVGPAFERLTRVFALLGAVVLFGVLLMVVYEVVMRYLLDSPTKWTLEVSELCMAAIVFLPLAWIQAEKRHIRIDLITSRLSPKRQAVVALATYCISSVVLGLLTWKSWGYAWHSFQFDMKTAGVIPMPLFPAQVMVPIGCGLFCLQCVVDVAMQVASMRSADYGSQAEGRNQETPEPLTMED